MDGEVILATPAAFICAVTNTFAKGKNLADTPCQRRRQAGGLLPAFGEGRFAGWSGARAPSSPPDSPGGAAFSAGERCSRAPNIFEGILPSNSPTSGRLTEAAWPLRAAGSRWCCRPSSPCAGTPCPGAGARMPLRRGFHLNPGIFSHYSTVIFRIRK